MTLYEYFSAFLDIFIRLFQTEFMFGLIVYFIFCGIVGVTLELLHVKRR